MRKTKVVNFELKSIDSEKGIFEGYASVFGNIDDGGDIIYQGAFERTIKDDFNRIVILALHDDSSLPIGKPLELREDDKGLYMKAKISETSTGKDVLQLMRDGVLKELSIGYEVDDGKEGIDGIRHLYELTLFEVSVVTWAMNSKAKITDVKSNTIKKEKVTGTIRNRRKFKRKIKRARVNLK